MKMPHKNQLILPNMVKPTFDWCRARFEELWPLIVAPVIMVSLINGWANVRFQTMITEFQQQAGADSPIIDDPSELINLWLMGDWSLWINMVFSVYIQLLFMKAVLRLVLGQSPPLPLSTFFIPSSENIRFVIICILLTLLAFLPGAIIASVGLGFFANLIGLFIFFGVFILVTFYSFARLSPSFVRAAYNQWMPPMDAVYFSGIKGWFHNILAVSGFALGLMIIGEGVVALLSQGVLNALDSLDQAGQSLSFNVILALMTNFVGYAALTPLVVVVGLLYHCVAKLPKQYHTRDASSEGA